MAVEAETARSGQEPPGSEWSVPDHRFFGSVRRPMGWLSRDRWTAPILAVSTSVLAAFCIAQIVSGGGVRATAFAAIGLAALGAAGFAGLKAHAALATRLDILARALDAVPEAQVIVTA